MKIYNILLLIGILLGLQSSSVQAMYFPYYSQPVTYIYPYTTPVTYVQPSYYPTTYYYQPLWPYTVDLNLDINYEDLPKILAKTAIGMGILAFILWVLNGSIESNY